MKGKTIIWIVLILAILVLVKIVFFKPKQSGPPQAAGKGGGTPSTVTVYVAQPKELNNTVFATGTLLANEEVMLNPEISGKIVQLNIKEGEPVAKGELLVKISDAEYQATLKKLELQAKLSDERSSRQKQLLQVKGISQEEFDISVNELNSIKADIEYTKALIAKTEIRAPFNGIIGLKYVSEGAYVNPSSKIAAIQQINPVKIDFSVPEKYAGVIQKNTVVEFTIEGVGKKQKARVYAVEPKIDLATRTVQIRAVAENGSAVLFPGAFAKIELPLQKIENAIMIPTQAIIPVLKGKRVFVCRNGKAEPVSVETGIRTDQYIQVTNGLQAGDSVITTGIMQLKPGAPVKSVN
jgi:membrane fusion protein, multidrug efflux system